MHSIFPGCPDAPESFDNEPEKKAKFEEKWKKDAEKLEADLINERLLLLQSPDDKMQYQKDKKLADDFFKQYEVTFKELTGIPGITGDDDILRNTPYPRINAGTKKCVESEHKALFEVIALEIAKANDVFLDTKNGKVKWGKYIDNTNDYIDEIFLRSMDILVRSIVISKTANAKLAVIQKKINHTEGFQKFHSSIITDCTPLTDIFAVQLSLVGKNTFSKIDSPIQSWTDIVKLIVSEITDMRACHEGIVTMLKTREERVISFAANKMLKWYADSTN